MNEEPRGRSAADRGRRAAESTATTVLDVVVRLPKTMGRTSTVADARAAFTDDHVHMLLITENSRLLGTLIRDDLPPHIDANALALTHAVLSGRTVYPDVPADVARELLLAGGQRRLAVIGRDRRLLGLLCLKRRLHGFCTDDVQARWRERQAAEPTIEVRT